MTTWMWIVYGVAGVLVGGRVTAHFAWFFMENAARQWSWKSKNKEPDAEQWTGAAVIGAVTAFVWPFALLLLVLRPLLFAPPKPVRLQREAEVAKKRAEEREREIQKLDQELRRARQETEMWKALS